MQNALTRYFFLFTLALTLPTYCNTPQYNNFNEDDFRFEDLRFEDLRFKNFIGCIFRETNLNQSICNEATFKFADLSNASARKAYFRYTSFRWANLKEADFTDAYFYGAYFYGANLNGAIVQGADFEKATGLTNEQKKYLREHGAINVPPNLTPEEFAEETKKTKAQLSNSLLKFFNKIFDCLTCYYFTDPEIDQDSFD